MLLAKACVTPAVAASDAVAPMLSTWDGVVICDDKADWLNVDVGVCMNHSESSQ